MLLERVWVLLSSAEKKNIHLLHTNIISKSTFGAAAPGGSAGNAKRQIAFGLRNRLGASDSSVQKQATSKRDLTTEEEKRKTNHEFVLLKGVRGNRYLKAGGGSPAFLRCHRDLQPLFQLPGEGISKQQFLLPGSYLLKHN